MRIGTMNFGQRGTFCIVKKKEGVLKLFDSFRIEFGAYEKTSILKNYEVTNKRCSDSFKASKVECEVRIA